MTTTSQRHHVDREYHDGIAPQYDSVVVRPRIYTIGLLFEGFVDALGARDKLLDLGCGTGHMLLRYAGTFRSAIGVDHSAGMLAAAAENLDRAGIRHACLLRSELLAFIAECASRFDLITCVGVLHHLDAEEQSEVLSGIRRLCTASGKAILAEPVAAGEVPAEILAWNHRALGSSRAYVGEIPTDPDEAPLDEAHWRNQIHASGLRIVAESKMWEMSTTVEHPGPSERATIRALVGANPGGNVLAMVLEPN